MKKTAATSKEEPVVQTDAEKLRIVFKKICAFCNRYSRTTKSINANSQDALLVADLLRRFSTYLSRLLPDLEATHLKIVASRAKPSMPRVPWVAIVPAGRFVSNALSVAICFGRRGDGAVAGLMLPSGGVAHDGQPVVRRNVNRQFIDVDGNNPGTMYNDRFINPKEFFTSKVDGEKLVKHLIDSLTLLKKTS